MILSASRTDMGVSSASSTSLYRENTAMPGPIEACAMSTGAIAAS